MIEISNQDQSLKWTNNLSKFCEILLHLIINENSTIFIKIIALETFMAIFSIYKKKLPEIINLIENKKFNCFKLDLFI